SGSYPGDFTGVLKTQRPQGKAPAAFATTDQKTILPVDLHPQRATQPALITGLHATHPSGQGCPVADVIEARCTPLQRVTVTIAVPHRVKRARRFAELDVHRVVE